MFHDILIFNVCKFLLLHDMQKLRQTCSTYNTDIKLIMDSHVVDSALFGTVKHMKMYYITCTDVLHSSISSKFIDDMIQMIQKPHIDASLFKFTKRTEKYIRNNKIHVLVNKLNTHNKIYKLTASSDIDRDFKVFMFLLYLTDQYLQDKMRYIFRIALIAQLITYFEETYDKLMSVVNADVCLFLHKSKQKIANYFRSYFYYSPIYENNINMYHYYSIMLTTAVDTDASEFCAFKKAGIYDHMLVTPLFQYNHDESLQTIQVLIDMVLNARQLHSKTYMISMLFSYINYIISDGSFEINNGKNMNFIQALREKAAEFVHKLDPYISQDEYFAIVVSTLRCTLSLLRA